MKSFQQYITEVFDKPYKWKQVEGPTSSVKDAVMGSDTGKTRRTSGSASVKVIYKFQDTEKGDYEYEAIHFLDRKSQNHVVDITFYVPNAGGGRGVGMTDKDDAFRVMATVLDITKHIVENDSPDVIKFTGEPIAIDDFGVARSTGRTKTYSALVKRFASKAGYNSKVEFDDVGVKVKWKLTKK